MKMLLKIFLVLLPAFVECRIRVFIKASSLEAGAHVEYIGANVGIVSENDIYTFGLDGDSLAEGILQFGNIHGNINAKCFAKNGATSNLHQENGWNEVNKRIIPMTGDVVRINAEKVNIISEEVHNVNDKAVRQTLELKAEPVNIVEIYWSKALTPEGEATVHEIDYGIDGIDNIIQQAFEVPIGMNTAQQKPVEIFERVLVKIEPYQKVEAKLFMTEITLDVQVNYTVSFAGDIACDYEEAVKGQRLWAFDVNRVLEAANKPNNIVFSEFINVVFYSSPEVIVTSDGIEDSN